MSQKAPEIKKQVVKEPQDEREPVIVVGLGKRGSGKTFQRLKFLQEKYTKNLPGKKGRKALIYDTNKEFETIDPIRFQDLKAFMLQKTIEIRRVLPVDPITKKPLGVDGKLELLEAMLDKVQLRDMGLYLEDINSYMTAATSKKMINLLTTNRHYSLDLFMNFQTFRAIPPRIIGNINILILHKTTDSPEEIQNKLDAFEITQIAHILVAQKYKTNKRFFCYVDFDRNKIYGDFSKKDLALAIEDFVWDYENKKITRLKARKSISQDQAIKELVDEYLEEYSIDKNQNQ
jgi:hypothetical protein